jgi:uncharacterized membrane protein YfcA
MVSFLHVSADAGQPECYIVVDRSAGDVRGRRGKHAMTTVQAGLLAALGVVGAAFIAMWWRSLRRPGAGDRLRPSVAELAIGFGTNLFDTLGVGSFAPTTALFRMLRLVPDELIPGTLNVGHTPPTLLQAVIYIAAIQLDPWLLLATLVAAVLGAWLGAGVVVRMDRRRIQLAMGVALTVAAGLFTLTNLHLVPGGGNATALAGWKFVLAVGLNFVYGALMTVGIGLYGPTMITLALLGMNPIVAYPVMMGSCAFLMPTASVRFLASERYRASSALGLTLGGLPAVLIAAFVVKELSLTVVRWLVVVVVLYVAATMLYAALSARSATGARAPPASE